MQPIHDYGGAGSDSLLHIAVANGFPPVTYRGFAQVLVHSHHVTALPPRPLWPGEPVPVDYRPWGDVFAPDLRAGLRAYAVRDVTLVGHSLGGIISLLVALADTERVRALVLLDPTILPAPVLAMMRLTRRMGLRLSGGSAERALKRRTHFADHEAAFTYFKSRPLFADWPDAVIRDYAASMLPDRAQVTLAWSREWEAYIYRTIEDRPWEALAAFGTLTVPLLVVRGGDSEVFTLRDAQRLRRVVPRATLADIPGHGHLFPMSAPEQAGAVVAGWLAELPSSPMG